MIDHEKLRQIEKGLSPIEDDFDRRRIYSVLFARIAAGIESKEEGWESAGFSRASHAWAASEGNLFYLIEKDADKAFSVAVDLALIPEGDTQEQETINQWIRTNGLVVMGDDEFSEKLGDYLENGENSDSLSRVLKENMNGDITPFDSPESFSHPMGFTILQSIYVGLGLKDVEGNAARSLYEMADNRRNDSDVMKSLMIEIEDPGCAYLKDRFIPEKME